MPGIAFVDLVVKVLAGLGGLGFIIAAISYTNQIKLRQAEWLKSLFEKFFENSNYKEVRIWLEYGHLHDRLMVEDRTAREANEEKFTDFLNFFEFIAVLYARKHLTRQQVCDVFDYYLKRIKSDPDCQYWVDQYSFEKLKALLASV